MVRIIAKTLLMGCLILLTYALLWFIPVKPHVVYASIWDKHERLAELQPPRLIFVGGSGIALGLDSELVESSIGVPVVNMGVNAGFGLRYMLDEVKPLLSTGDLVVISPEYEYFYGDEMEGSQNLLWALQIWGSTLFDRFELSWGQWRTVFSELPFFMQSRFLEVLSTRQDPIYNRWAFNERGDFVNHLALPSLDVWPNSISQSRTFNKNALMLINEFNEEANQRGATVYILPPAVIDTFYSYEDNQYQIAAIVEEVHQRSDVALLARPDDYVLPAKYFFDTVYHLNGEGRQIRTQMIVDDLLTLE